MKVKYIFSSDDFGPINSINSGIFDLVKKGVINSVHTIVNNDDKISLSKKLFRLNSKVPKGKELEIGLHLTITSGSPLTIRGVSEFKAKEIWGDLITKKNEQWCFKSFKYQYNSFLKKISAVNNEFIAQYRLLTDAFNLFKLESSGVRIKFTSISLHHKFLDLTCSLFKKFHKEISKDLAFRSNVIIPQVKSKIYKTYLSKLFKSNLNIHKKIDVKKEENYFYQSNAKFSSQYLDVSFYTPLKARFIRKKHRIYIDQKISTLAKMVRYSYSNNSSIVEFVFHVISMDNQNNFETNYSGINQKYYQGRCVEYLALLRAKELGMFDKI